MSRVLITGSTEGLGLMAARLLAGDGHSVTLHARSAARAEDARAALPAARAVVVGDLSSIAGMRQVAEQANAGGPYNAVSPATVASHLQKVFAKLGIGSRDQLLPHFPHDKAQHRRSRRSADSQGRPAHRGSSPGMASYQDAIHYWVTTIYPYGCAPVRTEHSVDVIAQTSTCGRVRRLADDIRGRIPEHQQSLRVRLLAPIARRKDRKS